MIKVKKKINRNIKCLIILILFFMSLTGAFTVARYAQILSVDTSGIFAKTIVLSSDLLKNTPVNNTIYEKSVNFSISNYNGEKITYNDLKYQIIVKDENNNVCDSCKINNSNNFTSILTSSNATQKSTDNVTVSFPSLGTYTIEATTLDTTLVTISSTVNVVTSEEYSYYQIIDKGNYIELVIKTANNVTNDTVFTINTLGLIPDNYNELMKDWLTGETQRLKGLNSNSVYSLLFFKTDVANNYDKQESIIESNVINITKN